MLLNLRRVFNRKRCTDFVLSENMQTPASSGHTGFFSCFVFVPFSTSGSYENQLMRPIWFNPVGFPGSFTHFSTALHDMVYSAFHCSSSAVGCFWKDGLWSGLRSFCFCPPPLPQGFTYVAPSVLENVKEKFSFEPKVRSPRKFPGSPRTPVR